MPSLPTKDRPTFALTAQALMAGGYLEATWSSGALRAWFKAGADFLIVWNPYHYDASFYVNINDTSQLLEPIKWDSFKTSFLPQDNQICSITVQKGLIRQVKAEGDQPERWIVNPKELVLATNSVIPIKTVTSSGEHIQLEFTNLDRSKIENAKKNLAVAPMGIEPSEQLTSNHTDYHHSGTSTRRKRISTDPCF